MSVRSSIHTVWGQMWHRWGRVEGGGVGSRRRCASSARTHSSSNLSQEQHSHSVGSQVREGGGTPAGGGEGERVHAHTAASQEQHSPNMASIQGGAAMGSFHQAQGKGAMVESYGWCWGGGGGARRRWEWGARGEISRVGVR